MRPVPTEAILKRLPEETVSAGKPAHRPGAFAGMKHSAFRYFFFGQVISLTGTWVQSVAQQVVVYQVTGSELALGVVACAQGLPALVLAPVSGVIAERYPRRKILVFTQSLMMVMAFIMAVLYATDTLQVWHIAALSFGVGIGNALDAPARLSFFVEMVGREDLPSAVVLNSMIFNTARVVGPALGGIALATVGAGWCFLLNGVSFIAVLVGLLLMRLRPFVRKPQAAGFMRQFTEGLRFARLSPEIAPLLLLSALSSTFGMTFAVLIPAFADNVLRDTALGTSALLAAQGIGALTGTLFLTFSGRWEIRGRILTMGAILGPATIVALSFARSYAVAVPTIAVAGFMFVCQFVLTNALLQNIVPDEYRGRVMSLYSITFFGLTPFGSLVIGLTGEMLDRMPRTLDTLSREFYRAAFDGTITTGTVPTMLIFGTVTLIGAVAILARADAVRRMA